MAHGHAISFSKVGFRDLRALKAFDSRSGVDYFSVAVCHVNGTSADNEVLIRGSASTFQDRLQRPLHVLFLADECVSEHGKATCTDLGGTCVTEQDGFYTSEEIAASVPSYADCRSVSWICLALGAIIFLLYIGPAARKLQGAFISDHVHVRH